MNSIKILFVLIGIIALNGCCAKKDKAENVEKEVVKTEIKSEKEMLETGFQKARIVYFELEKAPCDYLIELEDSKLLLEPQKTLDNEFKVAGSAIWIQYQPQRRMSNCNNAQPVGVIAIEKR